MIELLKKNVEHLSTIEIQELEEELKLGYVSIFSDCEIDSILDYLSEVDDERIIQEFGYYGSFRIAYYSDIYHLIIQQ